MEDAKEELSDKGLLQLAEEHLERGKSNFAVAWSVAAWTGDAGLFDFQEALGIQQQGDLGVPPVIVAKTQVWVGRSLHKLKQYSESLEYFKTALRLQESFFGRYHQETGETYLQIGNVHYDQGSYSEARLAYATARRVGLVLFGEGNDTLGAGTPLKQALEKMGFTQQEQAHLDRLLIDSIHHETRGNISRQLVKVEKAMEEYEIAAALAQSTFGSANPSFSFMWRKMACLQAMDPNGSGVAFDRFQPDSLWHECRVPKACQAIQQGDRHYFDGDYQGAIKLYSTAATMANVGGGCGDFKFVIFMALLGFFLGRKVIIFNKDEAVDMISNMKAAFSRKIEQAIAIWKNMSILVLAENTLWDRAGFKDKVNGSPDNDHTKNDLQASPVASKPPSDKNDVVGFDGFWEYTTLAQGVAHEKKKQPTAPEIILEQHDLQGQDLVTPEVKEEGSPATEHMDPMLAGCCETLGASFALSLTGMEDLEDYDESFFKTELDTDMNSSDTPTNRHDGISQREWMRPRFLGGNPKKEV